VELVLLLIFWALALQATPHHTQRLLPLLVKGRGFIEIPISPLLPLRLYLADLDEGNGGETAGVGSVWMTTGKNRAQLGPVIDYSSMIVVLL